MVVPKSLKVKLKNENDAFPEVHRLILEDSLENVKYEVEEAHLNLRSATRQLEAQCHPRLLGGLKVIAKNKARKTGIRQTRMHERKLRHLCENTPFEMNSLRENVVNRSKRNLSFYESGILGLGHGFNAETNRRDALQIVDSCEYFIKKPELSAADKNAVQGIIPLMLQSLNDSKQVLPERYEKAKRSLMQDTNIVILSADKGGKTVVMNRSDYNVTVMGMLCDARTYEKMPPNIMDRVHPDIRREVEQIVDQLKDNNMEEMAQTIKDLIPQTPYAAKFYGIPKLHKATPNRIPLRPIVSNVGAITRILAAWLAKYLQLYVGMCEIM